MILVKAFKLVKNLLSVHKTIEFVKEDNKWYAKVPLIYEYFKPRTEMVFGANRLLDYLTDTRLVVKTGGDDVELTREKWALFNGAFYTVKLKNGTFGESIWICPVTLFVYGRYPKKINLTVVETNR